MKHRGKKIAVALIIATAIAGGYASVRALDIAPAAARQEKSEKQKAFEEHLAQKEAEFDQKFNEVKAQNDEIRRKFDSLPKSSEAEVSSAVARSLDKSNRK